MALFEQGDGRKRGGTALSDELRAIKCLSKAEIRRILNLYLAMPLSQIERKIENPTTPMFDLIFCKVLHKAHETGDARTFGILLDRMGFPVKTDEVDVSVMRSQIKAEIELEGMPMEDVRALAAQRGRVIDAE